MNKQNIWICEALDSINWIISHQVNRLLLPNWIPFAINLCFICQPWKQQYIKFCYLHFTRCMSHKKRRKEINIETISRQSNCIVAYLRIQKQFILKQVLFVIRVISSTMCDLKHWLCLFQYIFTRSINCVEWMEI